MNTKEAIKFCERIKPSSFTGLEQNNIREEKIKEGGLSEVISLLQQGENDCIELADENQMLKDYIKDLLQEKKEVNKSV